MLAAPKPAVAPSHTHEKAGMAGISPRRLGPMARMRLRHGHVKIAFARTLRYGLVVADRQHYPRVANIGDEARVAAP